MSSTPQLSVVINTRNSATTLERAVRSVQKIAAEVVVMDMQSTDNTVSLAKSVGAKVFRFETNPGYTDPARNAAIQKATGAWTFLLDADEWIEPELATKIVELCASPGKDVAGYAFPRLNLIFGQEAHTGWWPDYQLRLCRQGTLTWQSALHSKPELKGARVDLPAEKKFALRHENYTTVDQFLNRLNVYTTVEATNHQQTQETEPVFAFMHEFLRRYYTQGGYQQGVYGQSLSVLQGMYQATVCLKELEQNKFLSSSRDVQVDAKQVFAQLAYELKYWQRSLQVQTSANIVERNFWRLLRKLGL